MSAVQAIATGRAPGPRHGFFAQRALAKLTSVPRPVTLGFASPAARPARTLVTVIAVLFGAAAVTFGAGLATSLNHVYDDINAGARLPVAVNVLAPGVSPLPASRQAPEGDEAEGRRRPGPAAADRGAAARHHHGHRRPAGHAALPDAGEGQPGVHRPGHHGRR
jgi:putative ABC transport system permease protein